ncbi:hypothetical protein GCM10028833_05440 [Glycomyces tarimensis]
MELSKVEGAHWQAFEGSQSVAEDWTWRCPDGKRFVSFGKEADAVAGLARRIGTECSRPPVPANTPASISDDEGAGRIGIGSRHGWRCGRAGAC